MQKLIATLASILFGLLVGPYFSWLGASDLIIGYRSNSWPTIEGVVKSSDVKESSGRRGRTNYTPEVKYEYAVEGVSYMGDRIDTGDQVSSSMDDAVARLAQYPKGKSVVVHYDPTHPSASLLEVGTQADNWLALACGLAIMGCGVVSCLGLWQHYKSNGHRLLGAS